MRFVVDENVSGRDTLRLLKPPYTVVFVEDLSPELRTTGAIATFACSNGWILITNDIEIYRAAYARTVHHPGVIEMETKFSSKASGEAMLKLLSELADPRNELSYEMMQDAVITIMIDRHGKPHFDLFDRFP